ncbi:MAG: hypothetical protein JO066_13385 [Verrucomicrobia bacterium]|nr:hypothetical protein [Verrucomicrobiota bacterium]
MNFITTFRKIHLDKRTTRIALPPPRADSPGEMLQEFPETDPLFLGADRLGRLCGRSGRWVRHCEAAGIVERTVLNGSGARERPVYNAEETLPKLVAFLAARKGPSPEQQKLMAQRIESGRLKLESQQLELDKSRDKVMRPKPPTACLPISCSFSDKD